MCIFFLRSFFSISGPVHHLLPFFLHFKSCSPSSSLLPSPQKSISSKSLLPSSSKSISQNPKPKSQSQSEQKSKPKNHDFFMSWCFLGCIAVMQFLGFYTAHNFFLRWCFLGCVAVISGLLWCNFWVSTLLWFLSFYVLFSGVMEIESFKLDLL